MKQVLLLVRNGCFIWYTLTLGLSVLFRNSRAFAFSALALAPHYSGSAASPAPLPSALDVLPSRPGDLSGECIGESTSVPSESFFQF